MALSLKPIEIVHKLTHPLLAITERWERIPLDTVACVQNGFAFKSEFFSRVTGLPLIRIRDINKKETENLYDGEYDRDFIVRRNDILIGMDGDFKIARWQGKDGLLNQRVCRLKIETDLYDKRFFFLCLQPYLDAIHSETSSVTVKHLSSKTIGEIPLPLPPLNEQYRIVAKIEELFSEIDKGVESLKTAKAQLQVYRQALLKHAFEGKLTAQWRSNNPDKVVPAEELLRSIEKSREERYQQQLTDWQTAIEKWEFNGKEGKKPSKPNKLHLPIPIIVDDENIVKETPPEWLWLKYGSICEVVRNGISKKPEGDIGTKIFRISAVRPMLFEMNDYRFINNEDGEFDRYYLNYGDLVFTRYNGSVRYVGVCAEYRSNEPRLFPDKLIQTRLIANSIKSSYIEKAVNCGESRKYLESKIRTTAGQSGVSGEDIKGIPVPICSELEQNEILNIIEEQLSIATQNEEIIDLILKKAEALRQSILKKAFSGQLVPQDPNDEPASELLKRIQAEKADRETATKTTKKTKK